MENYFSIPVFNVDFHFTKSRKDLFLELYYFTRMTEDLFLELYYFTWFAQKDSVKHWHR